ncbi:MAG: fold [Actinomycetota bacterium]|jgi:anti-anti-sigma factor|nr:fold [Actinomycetota bacterium]
MSLPDQTQFAATQIPSIRVVGELDITGADELAGLVAASLTGNPPLLIDLTDVSFVDMSGWRAIWDTVRQIETSEVCAVVLTSPAVIRLLRHLPMEQEARIRIIEPPRSESQRAQATLETVQWWRSVMFDQMGDAVLVADETMRYLDANAPAVALLGWSAEDLRERTVADVVAAQRAWTEGEYERFVRDGRWRGEVLLRTKNGTVSADANASRVVGPDGRRVFISLIRQHAFAETVDATDEESQPTAEGRATPKRTGSAHR